MRRWTLALLLVVVSVSMAGAQGVGIFSRTDCTTLTSPVSGSTGCLDTTRGVWLNYDGTDWQSDVARALSGTGPSGFYQFINVSDPRWGVSQTASAAQNTTGFTRAIAALPTTGGTIFVAGNGNINHNGITLKAGVKLLCAGRNTTILFNNGTGANVTVPAQSNRATVENCGVQGVSTSTHAIDVIDSMFFVSRDNSILSWGQNSVGINLTSPNDPGGNGTYFTTIDANDINCQSATGTIGIRLTGRAADGTFGASASGGNNTTIIGGRINFCPTAVLDEIGVALVVMNLSLTNNTTGFSASGVGPAGKVAANSFWVRPFFESNTTNINLASNANVYDHVFLAPSMGSFGTDGGLRTVLFMPDQNTLGTPPDHLNTFPPLTITSTSADTTNNPLTVTGVFNGFLNTNIRNTSAGTSAINRVQLGNDSSPGAGQILLYSSTHANANMLDILNANAAALRLGANNTVHFIIASAGGLYSTNATGGDKGAGTINIATADGFFVNNVALKNITETLSNKTLAAPVIGSGGTAITLAKVYAPSLTPAQLAAAIGVSEQTFTVTGLTTADKVVVNGPAPTALCPPITYRVSAADTLAIGFVDLTAALCTPAAGTYNIVAVRS